MFSLFGRRLGGRTINIIRRWESTNKSGIHMVYPSNFDKKILVWTGKYKNVSEVPDSIKPEVMDKARSKFRIKYANYGLLITIVVCGYMAYAGRKAAERGESVHQMNLDWHEQLNKDMAENDKKNAK